MAIIYFCLVKYIVLMSFLLNLIVLNAQQMRIGVLRDHSIKRITFSYNDGSYAVFADTNYFGVILPNEFVELNAVAPL